jgi:hypothetical protein
MKKSWLFGIVLILVILAAGIGLAWPRAATAPVTSPTPTPDLQTYTGKVVCLSHKDSSGLQTAECALGILTAEGHYYGVQMASFTQLNVGDTVAVKGAAVPADGNYDVTANIAAVKVTIISNNR